MKKEHLTIFICFQHITFLREILQNESIVFLNFQDILKLLGKVLSKSYNNQLILLSQYIKCFNVSLPFIKIDEL